MHAPYISRFNGCVGKSTIGQRFGIYAWEHSKRKPYGWRLWKKDKKGIYYPITPFLVTGVYDVIMEDRSGVWGINAYRWVEKCCQDRSALKMYILMAALRK